MKNTGLKHQSSPSNRFSKKAVLSLTLFVTISASAAIGVYNPHRTNQKLSDHLRDQKSLISKQIEKQQKGYVDNIQKNTSTIVAALEAANAQEALSAVQIGRADRNAKQVLVNAMLADAQAEATLDAMMKFSPSTGQGYAACKVLAENAQMAEVVSSVSSQAAVKVNDTDNSPNSFSTSLAAASQARTAVHNDNFCTDAEGKQGICTPVADSLQGADSNAATLMESAPPNSKLALAKRQVRQNILGASNIAIPRSVTGTAAGQAYLQSVNHKTALSAFPAYSLAYLESMSEVREDIKDAEGNPQSPNDMLMNTVARYYGGADSAEWQSSMIAQQPRGLLVELAKMEGLGAWMDYQELVATQRMEGNIAAMTLVSTLPIEERLSKQLVRTQRKATLSNFQ